MSILSSSDYPAIRSALRVGLTATELPDATIAYGLYQGAAEAEIIRRDATAASRTGTEAQRVKAAAVLLTAAYLAPSMPLPESESIEGGKYSWKLATDRVALAESLRARALAELALATGSTPETPGGFQAGSVTYGNFMETTT